MAHEFEPRLEISAERINPGGTLDVRGAGFEFEETVLLELIGPDIVIPVGEVLADTEGSFLQTVTLPADLGEGPYQFRAVTDDHELLSPTLIVQGVPLAAEEGEEPREDEDALLAPMPTSMPGAMPPPAGPTAASPKSTLTRSSPAGALIILAAILGVLVAGWSVLKRR